MEHYGTSVVKEQAPHGRRDVGNVGDMSKKTSVQGSAGGCRKAQGEKIK